MSNLSERESKLDTPWMVLYKLDRVQDGFDLSKLHFLKHLFNLKKQKQTQNLFLGKNFVAGQ